MNDNTLVYYTLEYTLHGTRRFVSNLNIDEVLNYITKFNKMKKDKKACPKNVKVTKVIEQEMDINNFVS